MRYALVLMFAVVITGNAFGCGLIPCFEQAPTSQFGRPACNEWEMNNALIDALEHGDRGVAVVLRQRYRETYTFSERNRIGAALIKAKDDSEVWKELFARAEDAVRFAPNNDDQPNAELAKWCEKRGWDADEYWSSLNDSFWAVADDPRALQLLRGALQSANKEVADGAILALVFTKRADSLALVDEVFGKRGTPETWLVTSLAYVHTDAADAIAMKYLKDNASVAQYRAERDQQN
jgi:hypothetical protein